VPPAQHVGETGIRLMESMRQLGWFIPWWLWWLFAR
jgi:hypothetical protein